VETSGVEVSAVEARRIALAAQRIGRPRPAGTPDLGQVRRLVAALGAVQIDAVNVLVRAHYLPLLARLGPYPRQLLDRLVHQRRAAFEYWGHAASIMPIELHPASRWRMARHATDRRWQATRARIESERPGYLAAVEKEVAERGPLTFTDLTDRGHREPAQTGYAESSLLWYRWSDGKTVLDGLYSDGRLAVAGRRGFERLYDLAERVIPAEVLAAPTPTVEDAQRELVRRATDALGVATVKDVADYFRLPVATTRARLRELVDAGSLRPTRVTGWSDPAYLSPAADPAPVHARALISPFDSLIWERTRSERVFGFRPSFELYLPPAKRRYGYYVLGFLLDEAFAARVDLKADRQRGTLLVRGAFAEPGAAGGQVAAGLAATLRELAAWLELETVEVADRGDLAASLRPLVAA
jgi:uncharacterized protein